MRTTFTLDDDLYHEARLCSAERQESFKDFVNHALRAGIETIQRPQAKPYRVRTADLGLREGLSYDSIPRLLARIEGADWK